MICMCMCEEGCQNVAVSLPPEVYSDATAIAHRYNNAIDHEGLVIDLRFTVLQLLHRPAEVSSWVSDLQCSHHLLRGFPLKPRLIYRYLIVSWSALKVAIPEAVLVQ